MDEERPKFMFSVQLKATVPGISPELIEIVNCKNLNAAIEMAIQKHPKYTILYIKVNGKIIFDGNVF